MLKKIKLSFLTLLTVFSTSTLLLPPSIVAETPRDAACKGLELTGGGCDDPANPDDPNSSNNRLGAVLKTVINIFSMIVGVVAVIMIIISGLKYITSMGDSTSTASAKNTLLYAVIGLVIVAMAQVIVRFVLGRI